MKVFAWRASVLLLLVAAGPVSAADIADFFKNADQRAVELLENGQAEAASGLFKNPKWQGVSQYRAGSFEDAMRSFSLSDDAMAHYNHGTAAARAGDYNQAVSSLEKAQRLSPDDKRIDKNLEIARKLKDLAEQSEQQQNESDSPQDQQQEGEESQDQQDQQSEQQSDEQSGDQSSDESQGEGEDSDQQDGTEQDGDPQDKQGELNADEAEQQNDNPSDPELEELRQQLQQQQAESEAQETSDQAVASSSVSEDDQATEQWLRRIPDDASQLLRNKIRLNHLIEYPDVRDMEESW